MKDGELKASSYPDEQVKTTINPMSGSQRRKTEKRRKILFNDSEAVKISESAKQEGLNLKFAYKRGSFYIVDAFQPRNSNPFTSTEPDTKGIRVSEGQIQGIVGQDVGFVDETVHPEGYSGGLISRKGGYTSRDAQLARNDSKPAIFGFKLDLNEGQRVNIDSKAVTPEEPENFAGEDRSSNKLVKSDQSFDIDSVTALEVLPLNSDGGICLSPPFIGSYAVTNQDVPGRIPASGYLKSYSEIFGFEGDKAVVDTRRMEHHGLENALGYLDAETLLLIVDRPEPEVVAAAVKAGVDGIGIEPRGIERLRKAVNREEKRFIIEKLRSLED